MRLVVALSCAAMLRLGAQATVPFVPGMVVTRSMRIAPGRYNAPAGDSSAITVRGNDITLDLTGVQLVGSPAGTLPDRFAGTAIRIIGGRNVTVRGVHARGYKVGILARGVTRLALVDNDLSYNYKPKLYSGIVKESLVDWLDYHQNEKDEWLRYGAGIYLADVNVGEIKGNTVVQGMNGLMVTRSTGVRVWNNTLSWNSGVGMGLYRSSHNTIMHNRIDYDVRGYSDGFYNRGQDSAGLLIYEQSSNNVIAFNSVTHSGDGLFLWAGQSTMDSGKGGCNDNLIYHNDFSYAPTNGMEATFSRNAFVDNRVAGNWHGLWGGYSYGSVVLGNRFSDNVEAISVEHGQDNRITGNSFSGDTVAIHLWADSVAPSDWGYPRYRDIRSRDYVVLGNTFDRDRVALRVANTERLRADDNSFHGVDTLARVSGDTAGWFFAAAGGRVLPQPIPAGYRVAPLAGGMSTAIPAKAQRGRAGIIVDEWGPYDWKSPKLWPAGRDDGDTVKLRTLGPPGRWRVVAREGIARVSADSGRMGDTLMVIRDTEPLQEPSITLEYRGVATTSPTGEHQAAGAPVRFTWSDPVVRARWAVRFFRWDSVLTQRKDSAALQRTLRSAPVATLDTNRLDFTWYGPPRKSIPQANVLTEATTMLTLAPGRYIIRTIADDAIRIYVDDVLVLDDWTPGESRVTEVPFTATGTHRFRVEHLQVDGWYELTVVIERS